MSLSLEQASGGSFVLSKAGLAIGSTASQLSTAATAVYTLDGIYQTSKAGTATFALTAVSAAFPLVNIPAGSKANFGVWLDSAGNFTVTQGAVAAVAAATDKTSPPPNPGARALVGVASVYTATNAFVPATTAFNAAGVTTTYFDTASLPAGSF